MAEGATTGAAVGCQVDLKGQVALVTGDCADRPGDRGQARRKRGNRHRGGPDPGGAGRNAPADP